MTREELEQILALPGTSVPYRPGVTKGYTGPVSTEGLKSDKNPFIDPRQPLITAQQQPVEDQTQAMASLGMDPNGNPLADAGTPLSPLAANTPDNIQITTAGGPVDNSIEQAALRAPEYFGTDFIASGAGGPTNIVGQGFSDPSAREPKSFGEAWDRFMSRPGTGTALMKAGAAIMGGRTPLEGLGAGVNAFSGHFEDERLREQQRQDEYNKLVLQAQLKGAAGSTKETVASKYEERKKQAAELGLEPGTPLYQQFVGTGTYPSSNGLSASQMKAQREAKASLAEVDYTLGVLGQALELLNSGNVLEGAGAEALAQLGGKLPDNWVPDSIVSREKAETTLRYQNIMTQEAITAMANSLKGATTNFELEEFKKIMADMSVPISVKRDVLNRMIAKANMFKGTLTSELGAPASYNSSDVSVEDMINKWAD